MAVELTAAQRVAVKEMADRVIREFVVGVQDGITKDWLIKNERDRGTLLTGPAADYMTTLVRTAQVEVLFYPDGDGPTGGGESCDELDDCTVRCMVSCQALEAA